LPDFVEPMKAKLVGSMPVGAWIYEISFDGYRALALRAGGETRILSRNEKGSWKQVPGR
jgi:bifunctional non-homologous end joining protein LigD